eukprot:TRINITY_DN12994_c0_g1_i1.p1 TRINITY_DN12994_c0_g1~~TRINITY_DN12994_c0_g1_i1.p1  ORF type:complete len:200 (-),score=68.58 TRINITY_DN12994_c0_g1_i1:143-718(-)
MLSKLLFSSPRTSPVVSGNSLLTHRIDLTKCSLISKRGASQNIIIASNLKKKPLLTEVNKPSLSIQNLKRNLKDIEEAEQAEVEDDTLFEHPDEIINQAYIELRLEGHFGPKEKEKQIAALQSGAKKGKKYLVDFKTSQTEMANRLLKDVVIPDYLSEEEKQIKKDSQRSGPVIVPMSRRNKSKDKKNSKK